jgi:hypothetical protein
MLTCVVFYRLKVKNLLYHVSKRTLLTVRGFFTIADGIGSTAGAFRLFPSNGIVMGLGIRDRPFNKNCNLARWYSELLPPSAVSSTSAKSLVSTISESFSPSQQVFLPEQSPGRPFSMLWLQLVAPKTYPKPAP